MVFIILDCIYTYNTIIIVVGQSTRLEFISISIIGVTVQLLNSLPNVSSLCEFKV